eukprot:454140-Pelagomonas_calceolata.AAC.1
MGAPRVTSATWPEAARRYLSAAATAAYLSMASGRPPSLVGPVAAVAHHKVLSECVSMHKLEKAEGLWGGGSDVGMFGWCN